MCVCTYLHMCIKAVMSTSSGRAHVLEERDRVLELLLSQKRVIALLIGQRQQKKYLRLCSEHMECVRFSESVCCFFGTQFSSCAKSTSDSALCTWNVFAIVFLSQKYLRIESVLCRFHVFSRALVPETRHSPADIVLFAIFCCTFLPLPQRKPSPLNRCCKHTGARACAEMMRRGPDPRSRPWRVT